MQIDEGEDHNPTEGDLNDWGVIDDTAERRETMFLVDHGVADERALIDLTEDNYLPYESRVPIELHNFSRAMTAEANARFRIPLIKFINEANEFTANRGFDDVYIDARVYVDENTPSKIITSFAVLVLVPENDHLDTISRMQIAKTFEASSPWVNDSEHQGATFAQLWGLDGLGAPLVSELLERHFDYVAGAAGINLTEGGMLNFEVNLMARGLSRERFTSASEDLERCQSTSDPNIAKLVSQSAKILPIVESADECDTEALKENVVKFIIEIAKIYRQAFGKGATTDYWIESTSIDEAFCLDIGCCAIFKRDVLSGMVSLVTGSSALTFGALADQVLEELKIAFEFADEDGEELDIERPFGCLEEWYSHQLAVVEEVFCSPIRWDIDAFSRATDRVAALDMLSPWYWMSPRLRLHPEFINICRKHELMVFEDMNGIPPIVRDRIKSATS